MKINLHRKTVLGLATGVVVKNFYNCAYRYLGSYINALGRIVYRFIPLDVKRQEVVTTSEMDVFQIFPVIEKLWLKSRKSYAKIQKKTAAAYA